MSDFAMHYRTKIEQNNAGPVSEKASEDDEVKSKRREKQNVVKSHGEQNNARNQNKNYVTIGYDCLFVDDDAADEDEVFQQTRAKVEKKSKKIKIKRNKNASAHDSGHHQKHQVLSENSGTQNNNNNNAADSSVNVVESSSAGAKQYKESTSVDSGIECDSTTNFSGLSGNFLQSIDDTFGDFLLDNEDNFLDHALDYVAPKFTCNRFDNILAFTLHAKNVVVDTIECQKLAEMGAARIKFYSAAAQQHYAFFVKITPPLHHSSVLAQHFGENNNTAMLTDVSAETWDNNVVFQIELDSLIARDVEEYYCGVSKYDLEPKQLTAKVLQGIPDASPHATPLPEDEGLSIEVQNSSESEISIAIKGKEPEIQTALAVAGKRRHKKKKNRSYSESCCDELKVISESETLVTSSEQKEPPKNGAATRKSRSISECAYTSEQEPDHPIIKYKSILKHSSFDSSADELFYSTSYDVQMHGGSTDPEMSESCKKSVRFSEHITRQLFRSTSSILAQKKKNQRKNEARRRLLERKNSECESTEEIIPEDEPHEEDEEEIEEVVTHNEIQKKSKKNKKRGLETTKASMIFDLEI
ncbi:protein kintoun-like [Culicoides brevitarsis]|uniref:protein kintoun-like n=1 Tax=Culicoides brevitarsis TaxID=469753 RepID=UPI00307C4AF8